MSTVVTRIPPSPTGRFHIGTARTALFNYLYARHNGGTIVFRSEDTDASRSKKEFEAEIMQGLTWLGISWDSFSRQSERGGRYQELLHKIVDEGKAYVSKEPGRDDPNTTVEVVRLKNPGRSVTFTDLIRGDITFDTTELGDFVIARSLSDALYHFAVVVDDMDAGVTHVIRGEDHISNTPRQILIQEALGAVRPAYAHLPLIVDEKRAKLSKRSGATSVMDYRAEGFLPEGLVNYLALLGWHPGDDREYFSLSELVDAFTLEGVHKGSAAWDREKLLSVNQHWMRSLPVEDYIARGELNAPDTAKLATLVPLMKERAKTFGEAREMLSGELSFFFAEPALDKKKLIEKERTPNSTKTYLEAFILKIQGLSTTALDPESVRREMMLFVDSTPVEQEGRGPVLWPLRYALSGQDRSPDPFTIISILGPAESVSRVQKAIAILEK